MKLLESTSRGFPIPMIKGQGFFHLINNNTPDWSQKLSSRTSLKIKEVNKHCGFFYFHAIGIKCNQKKKKPEK